MPLGAFANTYKRFGPMAALQDAVVSLINRFVKFRILVIYLKSSASEHTLPPEISIRLLSTDELNTFAGRPHLELPEQFTQEALANGDDCFGAFVEEELCAYAWYATRPSYSAENSIALFDSNYAYAYKNLTLPEQRGRSLQKLIKEFTFEHYLKLGKKGVIVAIDSINFASRASTEGSGAKKIGFCAYIKYKSLLINFCSSGAKRVGFKLVTKAKAIPADSTIRIEAITNLSKLLGDYADQYRQLLLSLPDGRALTYQPEWIESIGNRYLIGNRTPFFLLAWRGTELIGIAPFIIEKKGPMAAYTRRLLFWGGIRGTLNNMLSDFLVPNGGDVRNCIHAFVNYLYGEGSSRWDFADLSYISAESSTLPALTYWLPELRMTKESMQSFIIELPTSFQSFCDGLPRKPFSEIKRCRRKLQDQNIAVEIYATSILSDAEIDELSAIHNRRQDDHRATGRDRYSLFESAGDNAAFRKLLENASKTGLARHYILKIDGKIVSFFLGFVTGSVYHLFLTAFDMQYSEYGPTKILLLEVCQREIELHHTQRINLSTGESRYKREFSNRIIDHYHIVITTAHVVGNIRLSIVDMLHTLKSLVRKIRG
jgi:hypothetical protein